MKIVRKIKEVGVKNIVVGGIKRLGYMRLIKKYHFDTWHLVPYEWREYAQACVKYINSRGGGTIVDIGCGLGGMLRHVQADRKVGLDLHEEVIMAARELGDSGIEFRTGSFDDLVGETVDYLITLNFMHGGTEPTWVRPYHMAAERNDIRHFIVDTVPENGESHFLDWGKILPDIYGRVERLGPFFGGRYVEIWQKQV